MEEIKKFMYKQVTVTSELWGTCAEEVEKRVHNFDQESLKVTGFDWRSNTVEALSISFIVWRFDADEFFSRVIIYN